MISLPFFLFYLNRKILEIFFSTLLSLGDGSGTLAPSKGAEAEATVPTVLKLVLGKYLNNGSGALAPPKGDEAKAQCH